MSSNKSQNVLKYNIIHQDECFVTIVITEQSCERIVDWTANNGLTLKSGNVPCYYLSHPALYCRGCKIEAHTKPIIIPYSDWPKVKEAIEEYNNINKKWEPQNGELVYTINLVASCNRVYFSVYPDRFRRSRGHICSKNYLDNGLIFKTREEAQALCDTLNKDIKETFLKAKNGDFNKNQ